MANYQPYARTNYFQVKDPEAFKVFVNKLCDFEIIEKQLNGETKYAIMPNNECGWSICEILDEDAKYIEIDIVREVSKYLLEDEVAIFQEIGHDNMRYLFGISIAVNSKGEYRIINLNDIYEIARCLGKNITYCEY